MQVSNNTIETMIKALPYDQQRTLSDILHGKCLSIVRCDSKKCKGRIIATINKNEHGQYVTPYDQDVKKMYLFQSRKRFDNEWGFHCRCGNNSLIADQEKGIISAKTPNKSDIEQIWENLQKNKTNYSTKKNIRKIDNFSIEGIS